MLVKIFLFSIIVIVSIIILYDMNDSSNTIEKEIKEIKEIEQIKQIKQSERNSESCKTVRFNLDNNTIKLISPNNRKSNLQDQYKKNINNNSDIKSTDNISIINDKVEFGDSTYGNKIMDNSDFFNSTDHIIKSPQVEFVKSLHKLDVEDNDMFKNQNGYWESQTIDDFTHRTYDNNQVAKFNDFRKQNNLGKNIASTYDNLSEVNNRDLANSFGESILRHDDNTILGNMSNTIYGNSSDCNQSEI